MSSRSNGLVTGHQPGAADNPIKWKQLLQQLQFQLLMGWNRWFTRIWVKPFIPRQPQCWNTATGILIPIWINLSLLFWDISRLDVAPLIGAITVTQTNRPIIGAKSVSPPDWWRETFSGETKEVAMLWLKTQKMFTLLSAEEKNNAEWNQLSWPATSPPISSKFHQKLVVLSSSVVLLEEPKLRPCPKSTPATLIPRDDYVSIVLGVLFRQELLVPMVGERKCNYLVG